MPSYLTRTVFRRILANRPIAHADCLRVSPRPSFRSRNVAALLSRPQARSLFGFAPPDSGPRRVDGPQMEPGLDVMMELTKRRFTHTRPPPVEELVAAFTSFFRAKAQAVPWRRRVQDFQAQHALRTLRYLRAEFKQESVPGITPKDIACAMSTLPALTPGQAQPTVYLHLAHLLNGLMENTLSKGSTEPLSNSSLNKYWISYNRVMTQTGSTAQAWSQLKHKVEVEGWEVPVGIKTILWTDLLNGFCLEGNEKELRECYEGKDAFLQSFDGYAKRVSAKVILKYYLEKGDEAQARKWWNEEIRPSPDMVARTIGLIIDHCMRTGDHGWAEEAISLIDAQHGDASAWNSILAWSVSLGKGPDEIDRMINVLIRRTAETARPFTPDATTINKLVEVANSCNGSYMAERFMILGKKYDIEPNARSYLLQMDYRLSVNDLGGAKEAFLMLQTFSMKGNEDVPMINRYIQKLCGDPVKYANEVDLATQHLSEKKGQFEADTVGALCRLHLERDELHDLIDLLYTHAYKISGDERARVAKILADFCLQPKRDDGQAWDAYVVLNTIFEETPRDLRTQLMQEFFRRKRPDMAVHVFNHMRNHNDASIRANEETYALAFKGVADTADVESLEVIHNQMKVDTFVEPDTKMLNALMLANIGCRRPRQALDVWDDIALSHEGPSYNSIAIVFRACEEWAFGAEPAAAIWQKLRKMDVEIDRDILAAYAAALAGNGYAKQAIEVVEATSQELGIEADAFLLGTVFNACPVQAKQSEIENWIMDRYPRVWEELEKIGHVETLAGVKTFNINRDLEP